MDVEVMLTGYSTPDALRILHNELSDLLHYHETNSRSWSSWWSRLQQSFLHHSLAYSAFHWTSAALILISALIMLVAYAFQKNRDLWILFEVFMLVAIFVINIYFLSWDDGLRRNELAHRAKRVLNHLEGCIIGGAWTTSNYIDLNAPLSQCVSLQWTIRDSCVVNLPSSLLVEGDVILLRPGQMVPAKCRRMKTGDDDYDRVPMEFSVGDLYNPAHGLHEPKFFSKIEARQPLKPEPFVVLETRFTSNFSMLLDHSHGRPVTMLDNERFAAYSVWCERRFLPTVFLAMLLTNVLRYVFLESHVDNWPDMILVLQVQAILPLLALVFPIVWRFLDAYGNAKVELSFEESVHFKMPQYLKTGSQDFQNGQILAGYIGSQFLWRDVYNRVKIILSGQSDSLPRTANLVQSLGSMTSFCCIDKKGVLSWPNPTAEKVFILTKSHHPSSTANEGTNRARQHSTRVSTTGDNPLENCAMPHSASQERTAPPDFPSQSSFQVLDLTQDRKNQYGLRFDDRGWKIFMSSLKPLGLNILLNTCNMETADRYTEFADHVTCASLKREEAVPVVNRRCFCELANQIGFGEQSTRAFETLLTFGMYRHIPVELSAADQLKSRKSFLRYKMPMPNVFSVVVKDSSTGTKQLFSQGMADLLLDACSDYWDGNEIRPLGDEERKKIADFYHRTSMSSYCTAFAYRPLVENISDEMASVYLEVPEDIGIFQNPTTSSSWESHHHLKRFKIHSKDVRYHGSADSLYIDSGRSSSTQISASDVELQFVEDSFVAQCDQIFIGMITMQYQAKQDVVDLIESLESACIRFVHFSKENELRSRVFEIDELSSKLFKKHTYFIVFSEKMGLEAGWNCHISLLGEKSTDYGETAHDSSHSELSHGYGSSCDMATSNERKSHNWLLPPREVRFHRGNGRSRARSSSAPDMIVVRSEIAGDAPDVVKQGSVHSQHEFPDTDTTTICQVSNVDLGTERQSAITPLLMQQQKVWLADGGVGRSRHRRSSSKSISGTDFDLSHSAIRSGRKGRHGSEISEHDSEKIRIVIHPEVEEISYDVMKEDVKSNNSYMMSRKSSYTDSLPGVSGLSNRARLPKGINDIRSHIDNVDNVPLLVSLFTDCTPAVTKEMLHIMQDYGEVVCCFGSVVNIENTSSFLQADCSISIEPQYPQICLRHGANEKVPSQSGSSSPSFFRSVGPMELSSTLCSLPCSLSLTADDHITVIQNLVAIARHHCQRVRGVMLLYIKCQISLSLLQLINSVFLLPPALSLQLVLWLSVVIVPLLSFTLMGNPFNRLIAQMAQGKNNARIVKQTLMEEFAYFSVRYIPSIFVCIGCFAANLYTFCGVVRDNASPNTIECQLALGNIMNNATGTWNGWSTEYKGALVISQQFVGFQLVIYFVLTSLCSIHPLDYLWRKTPFDNRLWCIVTPSIVLLETICFITAISLAGNTSSEHHFSLTQIPIVTWVMAFTWPFGLVGLCELVKRHEIKMWVRHQKRARLDFGTKLGMNSPF